MVLCTEYAATLVEKIRTTDYLPTAEEALMMKKVFSNAMALEMRRWYERYENALNQRLTKTTR